MSRVQLPPRVSRRPSVFNLSFYNPCSRISVRAGINIAKSMRKALSLPAERVCFEFANAIRVCFERRFDEISTTKLNKQ